MNLIEIEQTELLITVDFGDFKRTHSASCRMIYGTHLHRLVYQEQFNDLRRYKNIVHFLEDEAAANGEIPLNASISE